MILAGAVGRLGGESALAQDTQMQGAQPQQQTEQPPTESPQGGPPQGSATDPVSAMVGAWELSNADHDKVCRLNFRADAVSGAYKLEVDKTCPNVFPLTKDMTTWTVDNYGNLRLLDAHGEAVLELTGVESGMFDGFTPEAGRFILQAAAAVQFRSADDMVGDWAIARGTGKPICLLTLANAAGPSGAENLPLKLKPGCDADILRFGPTSWRMDQGELVLLSPRGQIWRFEENDPNTWQRLPETPDPVLLVRQ